MINMNEGHRGGTMCLSKAGLAIGSNAAKGKTAAPNGAGVDYAIDGALYHKTDTDDAILFTDLDQADLTTCFYIVCLDTAGAVSVVQSQAVLTADFTHGDAIIPFPEIPAGKCPIGWIALQTSGAAFDGGTTELSAATVTDYYKDILLPKAGPFVAADLA